MRSKLIYSAFAILFVLLAYQCSVALKMPTISDAQKSGISLDTLTKGRDLYIRNCSSCHSLYLPEKFTASQWSKNVEEMKKPAKISDEQAKIILLYLTSNSKP